MVSEWFPAATGAGLQAIEYGHERLQEFGRGGPRPEIVEALRNDTTRTIARESALLPDRERTLVLGIVRRFEGARSREEADLGGASSGGR